MRRRDRDLPACAARWGRARAGSRKKCWRIFLAPPPQWSNIGGHYPVNRVGHRLRDWLPSCPYLDLSGPNADFKTWLREGRWPLKEGAVVEGKS